MKDGHIRASNLETVGHEERIGLVGVALDARDLVAELRSRLGFLKEVGLDYLALDRAAPTLSGGEAQRIRLAAQLGSNLRGVGYVLDEPTVGLHPRDTDRLLALLRRLREVGERFERIHFVLDPATARPVFPAVPGARPSK